MWNRTGTVTVTNGSPVVTGTGTNFSFPNAQAGQGFVGPNGLPMEILSVDSATQLTLASPYTGATANGQPFAIFPTQSFANDLALAFSGFKNTYGATLDSVGQGMFGDGSVAAPGVRFASDQDTGLRRAGENSMALVSGGADALLIDGNRHIGVGTVPNVLSQSLRTLHLYGATGSLLLLDGGAGTLGQLLVDNGVMVLGTRTAQPLAFTTIAAERMRIDTDGKVGIGTTAPTAKLELYEPSAANGIRCIVGAGTYSGSVVIFGVDGQTNGYQMTKDAANNIQHIWSGTGGAERARIDSAGNFLIGRADSFGLNCHTIARGNAEGDLLLNVTGNTLPGVQFFSCGSNGANAAAASMKVATNATTGRSINAGGTINANGADYAEYMVKAAGCGLIAKGDVVGVDRDGKLTQSWASAIAYMVKSTDPNLVGGDSYAQHLGARPKAPLYEAPAYDGPAEPVEAADEDARQYAADRTAYDQAQAGYAEAVAAAEAAHAAAMTEHEATLASWEADLETARQTVDRIAYSGQVPVNVAADVLAAAEAALADGEAVYLVAVEADGGIAASAVRESAMTLPLYMRRLGKVLAIRDGRPWMDVQHG